MRDGGFAVNGMDTYLDFGLHLAKREIGRPKRKTIKETVPYMNGSYDFSALNGQVAYEDRTLRYTFVFIGANAAEIDVVLTPFANHCALVNNATLTDREMPGYYFKRVYFSSDEIEEDDDGASVTYTVEFTAYPYRIFEGEEGWMEEVL